MFSYFFPENFTHSSDYRTYSFQLKANIKKVCSFAFLLSIIEIVERNDDIKK
jgi:hypothetical protein